MVYYDLDSVVIFNVQKDMWLKKKSVLQVWQTHTAGPSVAGPCGGKATSEEYEYSCNAGKTTQSPKPPVHVPIWTVGPQLSEIEFIHFLVANCKQSLRCETH